MSQKLRITGEATLIDAPLLADGTSGGNPKFSLVGYTGRAIRQAWSRLPLVVDLAGMDTTSQVVAVMLNHQYDMDHAVGQAGDVKNSGTDLTVAGEVIGEGPEVTKAMNLARKGWKFQASIGADVGRIENIAAGESVEVNGRQFSGPISVVRASTLREVSIVLFGADAATSAAIAAEANEGLPMAHDANQTPAEPIKAQAEDAATVAVAPETIKATNEPKAPGVDYADVVKQLKAELKAELLAGIRADRPAAPAVHVVAKPAEDEKTLLASICLAGNLPDVEKQFSAPVLEAAHKRRNIGVQEMLLRAAKVLNGYNAVESVWDRISMIRPVSDFKAVTGIRVNGGFVFEEVGAAGELKSAEASDEARSFGAKSYGRISSITRRDIINDDLGALTVVPQRLGRGAALRFNTNFWAEFAANNATYFERATAGAGNAFSLTSLKAAVAAYRKLTDADGQPLGVAPALLLLPPELEIAGAEAMGSALVHGASGVTPSTNVLAGRYQVVSSAYLTSATTWWLVANPGDLNAMEVLFLNGNRNPVVEQAEADFDTLGIQVRGYFDFGVAKGEPKSCYRMATA